MFENRPGVGAWIRSGQPIKTRAVPLRPAPRIGEPPMLKLSRGPDERRGGAVMDGWAGEGAARVLARDDHAPPAAGHRYRLARPHGASRMGR
ncbi:MULTISPECIES: aminoglycoside phosphotransferase family protein [Methylobacterium]|uniref:aminoglycoside phosphotransferase family protein n=1 Tax=Methylobacterium TaxID=407 RepID=UPI00338F5D94